MMMLIMSTYLFFFITLILMMINLLTSKKKNKDRMKMSPFECGFDPISSARLPFSIQFYLISIIFLIFDIEIIIFLPIISSTLTNNIINWMITSFMFILILLIGLYLEWNNGALTWLK